MAKIYFNRPIIKHLEEPTVLNFFFQKQGGESIYIRDTRTEIYRDNKVVFGDIALYRNQLDTSEWYCDIKEMVVQSYDTYGVYTGEGVDFEIMSPKEPIFMIRQTEIELSLATVGYMPQGGEVPEVALGMFHIGTEVKFRRNGVAVIDKLTSRGWVRLQGPSDHRFGIITVEEAFRKKLKREADLRDPKKARDIAQEEFQQIRDAKTRHDIHPELADSLLEYKEKRGVKDDLTYYFLASDVKDLVSRNIIL